MEALVFRDSPMAEYLEGQFEGEESWDVEHEDEQVPPPSKPQSDEQQAPADIDASPHSFAPPSTTIPKTKLRALKPLKISDPNWYRKARFRQVFTGGLNSRLAAGENLQFIERFRYILVASQLLNQHVSVSNYDKDNNSASASQNIEKSLYNGWFGQPGPTFWATSGVCVFVLAVLLTWVIRVDERKGQDRGRSTTALVLTTMVTIFLFAHARRRWLRRVRAQALQAASLFVESCQMFDMVTSNAITLISEVELVSRGYRLSTPLPPVTRFERNSQARKCARLRWKVLSSLTITIPPQIRAIDHLKPFAREMDVERFYDLYDIRPEDLSELRVGIDDAEYEDMQSLKVLKTLFQRLHTIRRIFTCHLLALEANGGQQDHTQWRMVKDQLEILSGLMGTVAEEIKTFLVQEQEFQVPPTPKLQASPGGERLRSQLRKLNTLSQSVRSLQAKMHLLREETDNALQSSADPTEFGNALLDQYDSIGTDVRSLVTEWESGRVLLALTLDRQQSAANSPALSALRSPTYMSTAPTLLNSPRSSGFWDEPMSPFNMSRKRISMGSNFSTASTVAFSATGASEDDEEVYEAVSEPLSAKPRSRLSRDDRIRQVQEERSRALAFKLEKEAGMNMVKELQTVLNNRPTAALMRRRQQLNGRRNFSAPESDLEAVTMQRMSVPVEPINATSVPLQTTVS